MCLLIRCPSFMYINCSNCVDNEQSLMAFYIWGNEATIQGVFGILLVIFGSGLYTWVQMIAPSPVPRSN